MLDRVFALFQQVFAEEVEECDVDRIRVATCALLVEVAGADDEFSPQECEHILRVIEERFDLTSEEAEELLQVAQDSRDDSHDLWRFTSQINACCTPAEKQSIIEEIWRVVLMDGVLTGHEDHLVHKLARLLNLDHPQLIEAKMRVRSELGDAREANG